MGMGILNQEALAASFEGWQTLFNKGIAEGSPLYREIVTETKSKGHKENYAWLDQVPAYREILDERAIARLRAEKIEIENRKFGNGLEVDEDDIEDDNLGHIGTRIGGMVDEYGNHVDGLVFDLLADGFTRPIWDGTTFFSTAHPTPDGGANRSNKGTATINDTGAFDSAVAAMMKLSDKNGRSLGVRPTHLVVGPDLRADARALVEAEQLAGGGSNVNHQAVKLLVAPQLGASTAWFLIDASKSIRPLILQVRRPPRLRMVGSVAGGEANSYQQFLTGQIYAGADWRGGVGYGPWWLAWGSDGST